MTQLYWIIGIALGAFIIKAILLLLPYYRLLSEEPTIFPEGDPRNKQESTADKK